MPEPTTAQLLGAYQRELIREGFQPDLTELLVRDAASHILADGPLSADTSGYAEGKSA